MVQIPKDSIPKIYASFMEEIKLRIAHGWEWLNIANERRDEADGFLYAEFCYLQVRRVAELVALAVLVAHNEVEDFRTNKFIAKWNADAIFRSLGRLNEIGFPAAIQIVAKDAGPVTPASTEVQIVRDGQLTKEELARIYNACGEKLHAGSLKGLVKQGGRLRYNVGDLGKWLNQILGLLDHHIVCLPEMKATMIVIMAEATDGRVHCTMTEMVDEGPIHLAQREPLSLNAKMIRKRPAPRGTGRFVA